MRTFLRLLAWEETETGGQNTEEDTSEATILASDGNPPQAGSPTADTSNDTVR